MEYTMTYPRRMTYLMYDDLHFILYLNEKQARYTPSDQQGEEIPPIDGFSYTGSMEDGGTLVWATAATYEAFVSGLIRREYSTDQVEALHSNMLIAMADSEHPRAKEFTEQWNDFQEYREECKREIKEIFRRE